MKINYPETFKKLVREEFPNNFMLHEYLEIESALVCIFLDQNWPENETKKRELADIAVQLWNEACTR